MLYRMYDDIVYLAYQCERCKKFSFRNSVDDEKTEPKPVAYIGPTGGKYANTVLLCIDCNNDLHKFMKEYEYY